MQAKDVMTQRVISVGSDAPVTEAVRLMLQNKVSGLPVLDAGGKLVGIVTEGDFLRRTEIGTQKRRPRWLEFLIGPGRLATEYVQAAGHKVGEIMTRNPQTATETTPLEQIVQTMERYRIKRLPVVRGEQVIGIVSRANLMHALASLAREAKAPLSGDAAIRERILAEFAKQSWAPVALINVIVRDGVAELWGTIMDERQRQALVVAAENVPGVKSVKDHLVWIEPVSGMVVYDAAEDSAGAKVS
jgi:CBS domain-containing protein